MKMIDQRILDEFKKYYKLTQGEIGFKLHAETEIGSADISFSKHDNFFYCNCKIKKKSNGIIEKRNQKRNTIISAQDYLVRVCCDAYLKLELNN